MILIIVSLSIFAAFVIRIIDIHSGVIYAVIFFIAFIFMAIFNRIFFCKIIPIVIVFSLNIFCMILFSVFIFTVSALTVTVHIIFYIGCLYSRSGDLRLFKIHLSHVEVECEPSFDFLPSLGRLSGRVIFMLVLFNAIGGKGKDKVLAQIGVLLSIEAVGVIDIFHSYDRADVFCCVICVFAGLPGLLRQVVLNSFIRPAGPFHGFHAEVSIVLVRVRDLQGGHVNVLSGEAVDIFVDGLYLGICQMEIGRESVAGDRIGRVEASSGNCVAQIDPEKVFTSELHVFHIIIHAVNIIRYPVPVFCRDSRAVFYSIFISYVVIVDASVVIEDRVEIDSVQLRDILIRICRTGQGSCAVVRIGQCGI